MFGMTPLMGAILGQHARCAELLVAHSDLRIANKAGLTALHLCVDTANEECFTLLLPRAANVDVRTSPDKQAATGEAENRTALHIASAKGQNKIAKALLKRGASRMARDSNLLTGLHYAAAAGQLSCLVELLGRPGDYKMTPAEVNVADAHGMTPLHCAARVGNIQCCGALMGGGARLDVHDNDGATPMVVAQAKHPGNDQLLALLAGRGPQQAPGTVCDHCGCPEVADRHLKNCDGCRAARYCSAVCHTAAWPAHKEQCSKRKAERERVTRFTIVEDPSCLPDEGERSCGGQALGLVGAGAVRVS
jgi:hypothetical protein